MSDDTVDRQHTDMVSLEDETIDEKIPKTSFTVTPSLPSKTHSFAAGSIKTFHKFGELPRELQLIIFQNALPASRIFYVEFEIKVDPIPVHERAISARLEVRIAKSPGLLPFLETCTASNASVYLDGGFVEIKVKPLNSGPALYPIEISRRDFPVRYEKDWSHKARNYTYMRPSQDILMVDADSLVKLYQYGGSLNLEGVTHIALRNIEWVPAMDSIVNSQRAVQGMIELLNLIEAQCPNLKRLSFVANSCGRPGAPLTDTQLLDINNDLLKLDLRNKRGNQVPDSANCHLYEMLSCLLKKRNFFNHKIQIHHKRIEEQGNKDSIAYWKGVEVVHCFHCESKGLHDKSNLYIPNLYVPLLDSFVRCNDDGTLAILPEDTPDSLIELRNTLSLINSRNEMQRRI